jgi:aerobic carbon-monoxide dehydrogenase medium subunit
LGLRRIPRFDYFKPDSFEAAVRILSEHKGRIRPLAGGTDLLIAMKEKGLTVQNILDLKGIKGYDSIQEAKDQVEIGALASIRSVETSPLIRQKFPFLSAAAGMIGSAQIRNKATLGGNLCNAAPSAETAPALICLRAMVEIIDEKGMRVVPLEEFFVGPGQTVLNGAGLMRRILIPPLELNSRGIYFKHSPRRAMDLAVVAVACLLTLDPDKMRCIDVRIVLGAVAPTPLRAKGAEALIKGKEITEKEIEEAGETAGREAKPITDVRGSAEYRTDMVRLFVKRGIRDVLQMIKSDSRQRDER